MNWTISTSTDAGKTWTKVQDVSGSHDAGMAAIAALQAKTPGLYSLTPADAATGAGAAASGAAPAS